MKQDKYEQVTAYIIENQDKFYRLAYSYVRNQEDALDIVQNAIIKALENYSTLKNRNALRTWFYRILVNESITYIRRHGKEVQYGETGQLVEEVQVKAYQAGNGTAFFGEGMEAEGLYREMNGLPLDLQNIIKLHYFEELKLTEVAEVLEMNVNSVKAKLYRGLKKMKIHMEENSIWEN